ncbi:sigma-70 family RNA polymerase sigma factor [Luteolibacter algae]|uniref:Sigma-70 family RNA polymerase sigma factor n=1 Tax=Luteolibacter algae TaxID=454151 RepID=A0ABW5DAI9_9BACT
MSANGPHKKTLDESDFMRLLMQHEPALRAFARSLLPNWTLVDEAIQEASLTIWKKIDHLEDEAGFLPWAKVIVRFKCLSELGKLGRDKHIFTPGVLELLAEEADNFDAEEHASAMRALRSCLKKFSKPHRELLLAPYYGDGRVVVLAEESGKSANSLYKLLGRLREKLSLCVHRSVDQQAN